MDFSWENTPEGKQTLDLMIERDPDSGQYTVYNHTSPDQRQENLDANECVEFFATNIMSEGGTTTQ